MKKNYLTLALLLFILQLAFSQNTTFNGIPLFEAKPRLSATSTGIDLALHNKKEVNNKLFLDTIFYEDFNGGLPSGWSIVNNNPNQAEWEWNTVYHNGQFSLPSAVINSTSASNGFMSLPADSFNTPISATGPILMDTYFESNTIDLTNMGVNPNGLRSVWISYQQALRYCCSTANRLVLQVSSDNFISFQEYDASDALTPNLASGTVINTIDISDAARFQTSIKLRFLSEGNSHYYWMIDDVAILEGPDFDMELSNASPEFNATFPINPFYTQLPLHLLSPVSFSGTVTNRGGKNATNARLEISVINNSITKPSSAPGLGLQYYNAQLTNPPTLTHFSFDTISIGSSTPFIPNVFGDFTFNFLANSDSIDQYPVNESDVFPLSLTDSVMAKDNGILSGFLGPANFINAFGIPGGTAPGDKLATLFIIEPNLNVTPQVINPVPTSISFRVSSDITNIGVEILPKIFDFSATSPVEVASSALPYVVQAADTNSWLTLPLNIGTAVTNGLTPGQYFVGWETTSIAQGADFSIQQDVTLGRKQPSPSTLIYFGNSPGSGWGAISSTNPGIRLNFGSLPLITSLESPIEENTSFFLNPNPSNGVVNLNLSSEKRATYELSLRSLSGQLIYNETIESTKKQHQLNLSQYEKGIYLISLENEKEKLIQKIVLQ